MMAQIGELSAIEQLPHEVLLDIFFYLDAASLAQTAATSTRIRQVALLDVLWKQFVHHAIHSLSPPVQGPHIHPLESSLPLWHPDFGLQADVIHPPAWPTRNEYIEEADDEVAAWMLSAKPLGELDLDYFDGASSLYQVYIHFVRPCEPLLGWWASDVPFFGMAVRIILDMHFAYYDEERTEASSQKTTSGGLATAEAMSHQASSGSTGIKRKSPSIVCQRVYPTNRLQGLDSDMERWSQVTGFPMPSNAAIIGQGTILRRSLTQIRTDLCEPGIRTENLWHFSWRDAQLGTAAPKNPASSSASADLTSDLSKMAAGTDLRAHILSQSWLRSLNPHNRSGRLSLGNNGGDVDMDDDGSEHGEELDLDENEAEEIDRVLRRAAEAPAFFNFGFNLEEDDAAHTNLRRLILGPHRHIVGNLQHRIHPLSGAVSTRSDEVQEDDRVQVSLSPHQPYIGAEQRNEAFRSPPSIIMPLPPTIFPPPALLPAVRSPPWSRLGQKQIGRSNIFATVRSEDGLLLEGKHLTIDSLTMTPSPPYRPWPIEAHALESGPRFFPIRNPDRSSLLSKPALKQPASEASSTILPSLSSFGPGISTSATASTSTDPVIYQHIAPPAYYDPAHPDFDWDAIEGLYSMTYGPHGIELLYIRARQLTSLDFEPDERVLAWPAEPLLSSDDMYEQTRISRRSAARVGARVLEAVKVLGDPNIPRGQVTWRAFIDDPGRSAVPWRPPPMGYRKHTPWPLRPPEAISNQDERSPGLVLPAHGRVAGEGFAGPGWATALACISSIDEIQIWWQPMYKISMAKKLIGV
ncbi:hypothetical protein NDA14_007182 [Ustilago hordei]|nr:hypothetical protein NDA14_007182 [Ustilago hordei]